MKKFLIYSTMILCCLDSVYAQQGFYIQASIQPGKSVLTGDKYSKTSKGYSLSPIKKEFTFGFEGGVIGGYNFTHNFGLSVGALYSLQGQNYKDYIVYEQGYSKSFTYENEISLTYINIPLRLNYNTDSEKQYSFNCYAGIYIDVLLTYSEFYRKTHDYYYYKQTMSGETLTIDYGNRDSGESYSYEFELNEKPYKSHGFGLTAGIGIQKKLSGALFLPVLISYHLGFTDVKNVNFNYGFYNDPNKDIIHKNSMLGIMIGLKKMF